MTPRQKQRAYRRSLNRPVLRKVIAKAHGAHDACMRDVLRGWTWDRETCWLMPLEAFIQKMEAKIHAKRKVWMGEVGMYNDVFFLN